MKYLFQVPTNTKKHGTIQPSLRSMLALQWLTRFKDSSMWWMVVADQDLQRRCLGFSDSRPSMRWLPFLLSCVQNFRSSNASSFDDSDPCHRLCRFRILQSAFFVYPLPLWSQYMLTASHFENVVSRSWQCLCRAFPFPRSYCQLPCRSKTQTKMGSNYTIFWEWRYQESILHTNYHVFNGDGTHFSMTHNTWVF